MIKTRYHLTEMQTFKKVMIEYNKIYHNMDHFKSHNKWKDGKYKSNYYAKALSIFKIKNLLNS